jgi:flagellin FlaB
MYDVPRFSPVLSKVGEGGKQDVNQAKMLKKRRGMTGLETAIILVAFVITAAAFAFVVLNMGFLTAEKAQSVISSGMSEAA